jgi:hypothetical protein
LYAALVKTTGARLIGAFFPTSLQAQGIAAAENTSCGLIARGYTLTLRLCDTTPADFFTKL